MKLAVLAITLGGALTALSCRNLDRFDTPGDAAFCGELVSGPSFQSGFVSKGQPGVLLKMKLKLDTSQLSTFSENNGAIPGILTSNDAVTGLCSSDGQALFMSSPVRAIPEVDHDSISTLSFGEGHDEDFFAWVDSTCQGTMLAVVSLLRKGDVELRLFKPAPLPEPHAGPEKLPGFALFYLRRSDDEHCGF
jgi:hypothetical protein